jgi:hypothetical protein
LNEIWDLIGVDEILRDVNGNLWKFNVVFLWDLVGG